MKDRTAIDRRIREGAERRRDDFLTVPGSFRCDVEDVGSWLIGVEDGAITVREGMHAADCIIECNDEDFWAIIDGHQNLLTAVMQGRVQLSGDLSMAQKLHGLMPPPPPEGEPEEAQ